MHTQLIRFGATLAIVAATTVVCGWKWAAAILVA
jgi:hypothetical protein